MKLFPNIVFGTEDFNSLYFFNTAVTGFSQEFYMDLLKETLAIDEEVIVFETIYDENYEESLFYNLQHPEFIKTFNNLNGFKPWMEYATMHSVQCLVKNSSNSIQIYADPHDWDVCIIACKAADEKLVTDWLIKTGNYERRMKSIDEFYAIWHEIAIPKMFDYAMLNLKENYMPFIR